MSNIRVRAGNTEIKASSDLDDMADQILSRTIPETKKRIESAINRIYESAYKNWPVSNKKISATQLVFANAAKLQKKGIDRKQAIAISFHKLRTGELKRKKSFDISTTEHSKEKLEKGFIIDTATNEIVGFVRNLAQYAWAIKVGVNSDLPLPLGANVSNELLWKPLKKDSNQIVKIIADEIELTLKR